MIPPVKQEFLDANLRRTAFAEDAVFVETNYGETRAIRSYEKNTVKAAKETCHGRKFPLVGEGAVDQKMVLGPFVFTWSPEEVWKFSGKHYSISLKPSCSRDDAREWLKAFVAAEKQSSAMHQGNQVSHILGMPAGKDGNVAGARGKIVVWYNLRGEDRLFSAALVEASKRSDQPISLTRMIHHEVAHTYESQMRDWLGALSPTIATMDLQPLAQELNPSYLPSRIESWQRDCALLEKSRVTPQEKQKLKDSYDEARAAEFLVEAYAHLVMEKKPWKAGLWPCIDLVAGQMKTRLLRPNDDSESAHQPLPSTPTRIMIAPKTLTFSGPAPKRQTTLV